ncbi:serine/threonine-protein kinase [Streptomyces sp. NBC_01216]|uniref:serine/threonine-protein kinase n=1 Tax=Streptomyces sp. NBC_01216 TaxID=2903778 RepID=UPI003FA38DFD
MEPLNAEDPVGIGPFRLLGRLGVGGMGRVFLARSADGRTVAVKVVHAELAAQDEFRRRFTREVAALERVGGAGTAPVLASDTAAVSPWVAIGYVPGPSLRAVVAADHGPLPPSTVRGVAAGLGRALTHIHAAGLVHRDLKPSNVLLTVDGPRIIDFGIARAVDTVTDGGLTRTGAVVGSPGFMSPEQVRGERLTPASDLFCLGSVLAYAATGRSPFGTADSGVHATMFRIAHDEPDLTGLAPELVGLVRACLAKNPADRPTATELAETVELAGPWLPADLLALLEAHAAEVLEAQARAVASGATGGGSACDTTPVPSARPSGRWRRTGLVATAVVLAVAAGLAYAFRPDPSAGTGELKNRDRGGGLSAHPGGIVPPAFLGSWEGVVRGSAEHPRETARFDIAQGAVGAKNVGYVQVTEERLCMGHSRLVSADEDALILGESDVTTGVPARRCTPAAHQSLTLRSPDVLVWTSGAARATFRRVRSGADIVPAGFLGVWKSRQDPLVYGDNADRYGDEVTVSQGPVGAPLVRVRHSFPRLDDQGGLTPDTVTCTTTALLGGAGGLLVTGPQTRDSDDWDPECGEAPSQYLRLDRSQGEERLLMSPMTDSDAAPFHRS